MFFNRAIVRAPNPNNPYYRSKEISYEEACKQHDKYTEALYTAGLFTVKAKTQNNCPADVFTEDTHLILNEVVIRLNPLEAWRRDEPFGLRSLMPPRHFIAISKGLPIDGGNILVVDKRIYVGLSCAGHPDAIKELTRIVSTYGYQVVEVPIQDQDQGHLKGGVTCINKDTFLVLESFKKPLEAVHKALGETKQYFVVPPEEYIAANVLPLNEHIIIPENCPKTKEFILGFYSEDKVLEVNTSEFCKLDGRLTCMSLPYCSDQMRLK